MKRIVRLFTRWRRLPAAERRFTVHVWLLFTFSGTVLTRTRLDPLLARRVRIAGASRLAPERAAALVEAVAAVHPCRPRCLARALVGVWALRTSGLDVHLVIGCTHDGPFQAHAWVRADGRTLIGGGSAPAYREIHAFEGTEYSR